MVGVSRHSNFMRWVTARQYKASRNKDATHLLLCGGTLRIPDEEQALELLAKDVVENKPNYVVECRTKIFKMCMDFDFLALPQVEVTTNDIKMYMAAVQKIMAEMYAPEMTQMILCHAPRKEVTAVLKKTTSYFQNGVLQNVETAQAEYALIKTGFHAIWPDLLVDQATAIRIRFVLHQHMETAFPHFGKFVERNAETGVETCVLYGTWASVLDLAIYTQNGLRMIGSNKASKCKQEHVDDVPCGDCALGSYNTGYIDDGRPYGIAAVISGGGEFMPGETNNLINNPRLALQRTSIRTEAAAAQYEPKIPLWFSYEQEARRQFLGAGKKAQNVATGDDPNAIRPLGGDQKWGEEGERRLVQVGHDWIEFEVASCKDQRAAKFEKFLNEVMPHGTSSIVIRKILISTLVSRPYIFATGTCKWCANVGREHSGQDVYFVFNGQKVEQRCWSSKDGPDRKHGPCNGKLAQKFFRDNGRRFPQSLRDDMFPLSQVESIVSISLAPTPPPGEQSRAMLSQVTAPGNKNPSCSPGTIQLQNIYNDYRRKILADGDAGPVFSYYTLQNGE